MLWFLTVLVLVAVSGVIAFGVGMIVTVVLAWAAWLVAYNDIFVTTRSVAEQQAVRREPAPAAVAEIIHPSFVKGACEHCGGHFEFSSLNRGQIIECPHCHEQTRLEENLGVAGEQARPRQKTLPVGIRLDGGSKATAAGAPANLGGK
jgi:hypothetical protein